MPSQLKSYRDASSGGGRDLMSVLKVKDSTLKETELILS